MAILPDFRIREYALKEKMIDPLWKIKSAMV
jgi:hypothetical protein